MLVLGFLSKQRSAIKSLVYTNNNKHIFWKTISIFLFLYALLCVSFPSNTLPYNTMALHIDRHNVHGNLIILVLTYFHISNILSALSYRIHMRGHNIFWDGEKFVPSWVLPMNKSELIAAMDKRIHSVVGHTKGQ